ncbi:MAG: hypothetical protein KA313_04610 [Pseudarcicella sp.]|nr:hypothetical protein [Pseudarcicella sp.]MBP6410361.1 hypothetical protein [Pseudarcicella sp.]
MTKLKKTQIANILAFVFMIIMNGLANGLPLNGKTTGELSALYPNLFVPAGITFSIWGLIYLLVLSFLILQTKYIFSRASADKSLIVKKIKNWFVVSCLLNGAWILAWHYQWLFCSLSIMFLLLLSLIKINEKVSAKKTERSSDKTLLWKACFGIYLGWILVASIANTTALLVNFNVNMSVFTPQIWTSILIVIGCVIGLVCKFKFRNIFVLLAIVWALCGILIARDKDQYKYPVINYTCYSCISLLVIGASLKSKKRF